MRFDGVQDLKRSGIWRCLDLGYGLDHGFGVDARMGSSAGCVLVGTCVLCIPPVRALGICACVHWNTLMRGDLKMARIPNLGFPGVWHLEGSKMVQFWSGVDRSELTSHHVKGRIIGHLGFHDVEGSRWCSEGVPIWRGPRVPTPAGVPIWEGSRSGPDQVEVGCVRWCHSVRV